MPPLPQYALIQFLVVAPVAAQKYQLMIRTLRVQKIMEVWMGRKNPARANGRSSGDEIK